MAEREDAAVTDKQLQARGQDREDEEVAQEVKKEVLTERQREHQQAQEN
jgi:hypothetical protein